MPIPPIAGAWWLLALVPIVVIAVSLRMLSLEPPRPTRSAPRVAPPSAVTRRWIPDGAGHVHLELATDAEPYERAVQLVKAELMEALPELTSRPDAQPEVTLRLRTDGLPGETDAEAEQLNALLAQSRRVTHAGSPVRVSFIINAPSPRGPSAPLGTGSEGRGEGKPSP